MSNAHLSMVLQQHVFHTLSFIFYPIGVYFALQGLIFYITFLQKEVGSKTGRLKKDWH